MLEFAGPVRLGLPLILSVALWASSSCKASYPTAATPAPAVVRLEVQYPFPTPDPRVGRTLSLVAYTVDAEDVWTDVTSGANWLAADASVIRVLGGPGRLLAVCEGTTNVVASYGGWTASLPITVLSDVPSYPILEFVNLSGQLVAVGGAGGATVSRRLNLGGAGSFVTNLATWTSSNPSVATVRVANSSSAWFEGHATGTTRITASLDGQSATLGFSVGPRR